MTLARRHLLMTVTTLALLGASTTALARATVVKVELWDKGAGMGPMGPMGIRVSKATVPAGDVTFNVTNTSQAMTHEMVISPVADTSKPLPYRKEANKVDEDAAGHMAEVADLEAGNKGSVTISMKPGTYVLYCNIPGHYVLGMWTLLTVK